MKKKKNKTLHVKYPWGMISKEDQFYIMIQSGASLKDELNRLLKTEFNSIKNNKK